jgi:hypothetical protein
MEDVQILIKIVVTTVAGGLTYLLTNATHEPEIWQLTMSIFVGGIVLVVQVLVDAAEETRRTAAMVARINDATALLLEARETLGAESVTELVKAAAGLERREDLQLRFADREVRRLTLLFEGLRSGRAEYEGEDRDWLLGLTQTASLSIDATSMTSFEKSRGYVDEGQFWGSDLGQRYLLSQRRAIERGVRIRRLFLVSEEDMDAEKIDALVEPHRRINVETRVLRSQQLPFLFRSDLTDFILFDQRISYELHSAATLEQQDRPLIDNVALVVNAERVEKRRARFEEMWASTGDD